MVRILGAARCAMAAAVGTVMWLGASAAPAQANWPNWADEAFGAPRNWDRFPGQLSRGQTQVVPKRGAIYITASAGKNLEIEINGKRYPMPFEGYDRAKIN